MDLLPLAEFAYNNAPSATTGVSPFFVNKGYHPNITVHPKHNLSSAWAREYAVDLESLHQYLCEEMAAAQKRYQGPADARRSPTPDFKVGDQTNQARSVTYHAKFRIIEQINSKSYKVQSKKKRKSPITC